MYTNPFSIVFATNCPFSTILSFFQSFLTVLKALLLTLTLFQFFSKLIAQFRHVPLNFAYLVHFISLLHFSLFSTIFYHLLPLSII